MAGIITNMADRVIHISETEAASNFSSLLDRVRAGAEVVIEHNDQPVPVLRAAAPVRRTIAESLALAEAHGCTATLDGDFARDLQDVINSHSER
jgi:antitoxin (DNA-binding transcriptional repressor) of toxin-antitoxin stability system